MLQQSLQDKDHDVIPHQSNERFSVIGSASTWNKLRQQMLSVCRNLARINLITSLIYRLGYDGRPCWQLVQNNNWYVKRWRLGRWSSGTAAACGSSQPNTDVHVTAWHNGHVCATVFFQTCL